MIKTYYTDINGNPLAPEEATPDDVLHTVGTRDADTLQATAGRLNSIEGRDAGDDIAGADRDDSLSGGKGDDSIWGDKGNDTLVGNSGDDSLAGSEGNDLLRGNEGADTLSGGKDDDVLEGGKGNDHLEGNTGQDALYGGSGDDELYGRAGHDVLSGGAGNDVVDGGSGDDWVYAGTGNDTYRGGSGFDTIDFTGIDGKLSIDLGKHTVAFSAGKESFASTISGFEGVRLNDAGGHVLGDHTDTTFTGGKGDDWFRGRGGNDWFVGGEGNDTYVYLKKDVTDHKVDVIADFNPGDKLDMTDFLKGHQSYDDVVRLVSNGNMGTTVQGLVGKEWIDVAILQNVTFPTGDDPAHSHIADLGILA